MAIFENIPSTNDYLKPFFKNPSWRVCLAETQSAGRGQFERRWYSPFGQNIYFSLLCPINKNVNQLSGLSLIIGLAIAQTCHHFMPSHSVNVKWPNDVIYHGKKLAGTLIELQSKPDGSSAAIIGVGVNVNMLSSAEHDIDQAWTSMAEIIGEQMDRNVIVAKLIHVLMAYLERFEKKGLPDFVEEWQKIAGNTQIMKLLD